MNLSNDEIAMLPRQQVLQPHEGKIFLEDPAPVASLNMTVNGDTIQILFGKSWPHLNKKLTYTFPAMSRKCHCTLTLTIFPSQYQESSGGQESMVFSRTIFCQPSWST